VTTCGLNLTTLDNLFPSFTSPFTDITPEEKPYKFPACYLTGHTLKWEYFTKFQNETLFYIFYSLPKDILQSLAALELYRREWRYHGDLKIWLKARTPQEMQQQHPTVQYVYCELKTLETRLFNAAGRANIASGIVSEEDIRMRIPASILGNGGTILLGGGNLTTTATATTTTTTTPVTGGINNNNNNSPIMSNSLSATISATATTTGGFSNNNMFNDSSS
jgi:hypothetical protein